MLPHLLTTDTLDLEGNELRVISIGQADTAESTILHVPSLAAVVTGDLAYNEVHMMTAETGETDREQWIANLDEVATLEPAPGTPRVRMRARLSVNIVRRVPGPKGSCRSGDASVSPLISRPAGPGPEPGRR